MQPYMERAAEIALNSSTSICVLVLLSRNNRDLELWGLLPRRAIFTTPEEFANRQLRSVGVVGLQGATARCAFKEPIADPVLNAIADAFAEYVRVMMPGADFAAQMRAESESGDFVAWANGLWTLPDVRD